MKWSYIIALLLALGGAGWIASGQFAEGNGAPTPKKPPIALAVAEKAPTVRVRRVQPVARTMEELLRGRTEAIRKVDIKAETHGRIVELPVERGQIVEEGQILAKLSLDEREALLREATALLEQRRIEHNASKKLSSKGFRSDTQVAATQAALEAAEAAVALAQNNLDNTVIRAPFAGLIDARPVEIGDFVETGDTVAMVVDLDPILVVANAGEQIVGQLAPGQKGFARLGTGVEIEGRIRFVSSVADPATRTFRVEVAVANPSGRIADGITAELRLPLGEVQAYRLSPAVLSLTDSGVIGVKIVDADNHVAFQAVDILASDSDGIWITGLEGTVTLITVGHEFVKTGQEVRPIDEDSLQPLERDLGS
ncbi:MAG TPA: efflux RND transporter periplasmic adaptor subunit [Kiloniellaceae bacterium]|nr:efflux RND transporter periplasmic adaptor subunit [Kiloniellaceae bacterium]